jgi:hypothetical protein
MATSPNYAWAEPDNSSLVKNGAQDIRALGDAIDTSVWNIGFGQAGKNKIINGDFGIWQRGTSFSNPTNGTYCADRYKTIHDGTGATRTISQQTFTAGTAPVAGYEGQYFMRYAVSAAGTSNTYQGMNQYIEDVRTFAGQPVTVSFWAKADAARTVNVDLSQNFGSGGSGTVYVTLSTGSASVTTSWQRFTFTGTAASIAGKTIGTGSALVFGYYPPAATVCTVDIWGVQVEYGLKSTPFEIATGTIQGELAACQRYYWRSASGTGYAYLANGSATGTTTTTMMVYNPVPMRTNPSSVDYSILGITDGIAIQTAITTASLAQSTTLASQFSTGGSSGLTAYRPYFLSQQANAAGYIAMNAEL